MLETILNCLATSWKFNVFCLTPSKTMSADRYSKGQISPFYGQLVS